VTLAELAWEMVGQMAEDVKQLERLAADIDDDDLNRHVHQMSVAIVQAGTRLGQLKTFAGLRAEP
jgi:hypothetical protein